ETHADCLRIITRAEMRMADEIDKGQAAGTISKRGRATWKKARAPDHYSELGITKQRVAEWRKFRDAGAEKIEAIIQSALNENRAPTKGDILKGIREKETGGEAQRRKLKATRAIQPPVTEVVADPVPQLEADAETLVARLHEIERYVTRDPVEVLAAVPHE